MIGELEPIPGPEPEDTFRLEHAQAIREDAAAYLVVAGVSGGAVRPADWASQSRLERDALLQAALDVLHEQAGPSRSPAGATGVDARRLEPALAQRELVAQGDVLGLQALRSLPHA